MFHAYLLTYILLPAVTGLIFSQPIVIVTNPFVTISGGKTFTGTAALALIWAVVNLFAGAASGLIGVTLLAIKNSLPR